MLEFIQGFAMCNIKTSGGVDKLHFAPGRMLGSFVLMALGAVVPSVAGVKKLSKLAD